jgi:hypothetical protein
MSQVTRTSFSKIGYIGSNNDMVSSVINKITDCDILYYLINYLNTKLYTAMSEAIMIINIHKHRVRLIKISS